MYHNLLSNLTSTDLILTPNRRLAAFLRRQHAQQQSQQVWLNIDILPLASWLERCWQQLQARCASPEALTLLTPQQEQLLWEQIIRQSEFGNNLLRVTATSQMAQQAWQLSKQWQIDLNLPIFKQTENSQAWRYWAKEFATLCRTNDWLDTASLPSWLCQQFSANHLPMPQRIILVGFDEISPQLQQLFALLRSRGTTFTESNDHYPNPKLQRLNLVDTETELHTMARWAHYLWQQGNEAIACVVPNLTEIRQQVTTIFTEIFAPEVQLPGYHTTDLPFNLSAGAKLKDFPVINTAFSILTISKEIKLSNLGTLLRSPYVGYGETEMIMRASFDAKLRSYGEPILSLSLIAMTAKKNGAVQFAKHLEDYLQLLKTTNDQQTPTEWANLFAKQLSAFGWPGQRTLDSQDHQLIENWSKLLTQFAQLELVVPKLNRAEALQQLQHLAASHEFHPKSPTAPVQILGLLEAAGLSFSHLWIMGLHDKDWPSIPNPNPFIPLSLQRELQLPHSSSTREFNYCRLLMERLTHSAPEVILSCPHYLDDQLVQPSPFLRPIKPSALSNLNLAEFKSYAEVIFDSAQIELLPDDLGYQIREEEKILGGASIFKSQAACPFRAFARFRLNAHSIDSPEAGLSPQERGSLLHKALETLWNTIKSQQQLLSYSSDELANVIDHSLEIALATFIQKRPLTFRQRFTQIEKMRLTTLLKAWLEREKNRSPFDVLLTEQVTNCSFANVPLSLKIDRIDQLANGSQVIIDYKTGLPSISDWLGERPEEPQLPLYCITSKLPIEGVIFAQIRSDSKQFKGITANDFGIPGTYTPGELKDEQHPPTWSELTHYWRSILTKLAQNFYNGDAKVDPKEGAKTCQTCDLQAFCRINDLRR